LEKYQVRGKRKLEGTVRASGAKNSALKLMAAAIMGSEPSMLHNVPDIADVRTMAELLSHMGFGVEQRGETVTIEPAESPTLEAPYHLVKKMRASIGVLGALLARYGRARVAMPGGDQIGARQIDLHLSGLSQMGAELGVSHGFVEGTADHLEGAHVNMEFASVGATENLLMAAAMARGRTVLDNAAREPEIADLADFLGEMGARVEGAGTSTIVVEGVPSLSGAEHAVIGDRIEAGTFLFGGAITRGRVRVEGASPGHMEMVLEKMAECGCEVETGEGGITVEVPGAIEGIEVSTLPYPGFPTDLQPLLLVLLATARGMSFVTENIFDNRFMVVDELNRLGADIRTQGHHAVIRGGSELSGAPVTATDLRAGAALVMAGLVADDATEVYEIHHIDRGYERFEEKMNALGAGIVRVSEEE